MEHPVRKPTRLKDYDYSCCGVYFLTVCTQDKKCIFSRIVGAIHESPARQGAAKGKTRCECGKRNDNM